MVDNQGYCNIIKEATKIGKSTTLGVSRAFGDFDFKEQPAVISTPVVTLVERSCDGKLKYI